MNKPVYYIIILLSFLGIRAQGQCPTAPDYFLSQDSIDNFAVNYPTCTVIDDLIIQGNDITSLANLSQITTVQGDLWVRECDQLNTLSGLDNIQSISQELSLYGNDFIPNLDPLNNLQNISGSLTIQVNSSLTSISGLSNLTNVGHILNIIDNDKLTSLTGLNGVSTVGPGLIIGGNNVITDLEGLNSMTTINGPLVIAENYSLSSISALSQLTSITDSLDLRNNPQLLSLDGLQNVSSIGSKVKIEATSIPNLIGLGNITSVHDSLVILNNQKLTSLEGLTNLTAVDDLRIAYNPNLLSLNALGSITDFNASIELTENGMTNLEGLDNIETVKGDFAINYNGQLTTFQGLENLKKIEGFFSFRNDSLLNDISALINLDSVLGDFVYIADNPELESLSGLDNLFYIGGSAIDIVNNASLTTCGIPSICYHLTYANFVTIYNNKAGCNNPSEVESTCSGPVIQGSVFADDNNNCQIDSAESPLANWPIIVTQGIDTLIDYTDQDGSYKIFTPSGGTYQVTALPPLYWQESCAGIVSVFLSDDQDVETVHFFGKIDTLCPSLSVDITNGNLAPCQQTLFKVNYCNDGTQDAVDAAIEVQFSDAITIESSPIAYTDLGDNTYLFSIGEVAIGDCHHFNILGLISCDVIQNQTLCATARITPDSICTPVSTLWSKASLSISGECASDSIRFTIKNVGTGAMASAQNYDIIIDDWVVLKTDIQLDPQELIELALPVSDSTFILQGPQVPNHPGNSNPLIAIEGCMTNTQGTFSTGYVLQFPEDDQNIFISIDCQEVDTFSAATNQQNFPKGYGTQHYISPNQPMEYKINFSNTSTDTLRNMVIKEVISPFLDLTSLQLGSTSHPYSLKVIDDTLIFHLSSVDIPSADINYPASFGFVKFKLTPKPNLASGTVITNTAYLHYGPSMAIESNEVFNTIGHNFVMVDVFTPPNHINIKAAPNPFFDQTTLNFSGINFQTAQISLFDAKGHIVRQQKFNSKSFILYKNGLSPGIYTFEILFDGKNKANGKISVF